MMVVGAKKIVFSSSQYMRELNTPSTRDQCACAIDRLMCESEKPNLYSFFIDSKISSFINDIFFSKRSWFLGNESVDLMMCNCAGKNDNVVSARLSRISVVCCCYTCAK